MVLSCTVSVVTTQVRRRNMMFAIFHSVQFGNLQTWKWQHEDFSPLSSYFTAWQAEIMLYSSFWRVGVNTNRSAAQLPLPLNRAGSNSSRDGVTWWESVLPPSLELPHNTQHYLLFIFLLPRCFHPSSPLADNTTSGA